MVPAWRCRKCGVPFIDNLFLKTLVPDCMQGFGGISTTPNPVELNT